MNGVEGNHVHQRKKVDTRSRLEINLGRLLHKTEDMAMVFLENPDNWRLEKYTEILEVMLRDLKAGPNQPERDVIMEYNRRIEFIKGVIQTSKLETLAEKAMASQLISPGPILSDADRNHSMEIKHRHTAKYAEDVRKELFGKQNNPNSSPTASQAPVEEKAEDLDELLKYHHTLQEKIADHMLDLTRNLKEQVTVSGQIVKRDTEVLEKSGRLVENNQGNLQAETERLETYNRRACKCWVWAVLVVICTTFMGMVLFMRLFKKPVVP